MKMTRAVLFTLALSVLSMGCATIARQPGDTAAPPEPQALSEPLTLDEAVAAALRQDGRLHAARAAIAGEYWDEVRTAAGEHWAFGSLESPPDYMRLLGAHLDRWTEADANGVAQPALTESQKELITLAALDRRSAVARDVRLAFAEAVGYSRLEALHRERLELLEELEEIMVQSGARGNRNPQGVIEVNQALRAAQTKPADAAFLHRQAMDKLKRRLGRPSGAPLALADLPEEFVGGDLGVGGDDIDLGPVARAELAVAAVRVINEGTALASAEASWPLEGETGPMLLGLEDGPAPGGSTVTATLLVPADTAASAEWDAWAENLAALQARAIVEIHHAVKDARRARKRLHEELPEQRERAESGLNIIRNMREAGAAREADVLRARDQVVSARIALEEARLDFWRSQVELAAALGQAANTAADLD
ncbi:MAG: TolC family protein [Candidatus Hydrogenedentota bacterium]